MPTGSQARSLLHRNIIFYNLLIQRHLSVICLMKDISAEPLEILENTKADFKYYPAFQYLSSRLLTPVKSLRSAVRYLRTAFTKAEHGVVQAAVTATQEESYTSIGPCHLPPDWHHSAVGSRREATTAVLRGYPLSLTWHVKEVMMVTHLHIIAEGTQLTHRRKSYNSFLWVEMGRKVKKK